MGESQTAAKTVELSSRWPGVRDEGGWERNERKRKKQKLTVVIPGCERSSGVHDFFLMIGWCSFLQNFYQNPGKHPTSGLGIYVYKHEEGQQWRHLTARAYGYIVKDVNNGKGENLGWKYDLAILSSFCVWRCSYTCILGRGYPPLKEK